MFGRKCLTRFFSCYHENQLTTACITSKLDVSKIQLFHPVNHMTINFLLLTLTYSPGEEEAVEMGWHEQEWAVCFHHPLHTGRFRGVPVSRPWVEIQMLSHPDNILMMTCHSRFLMDYTAAIMLVISQHFFTSLTILSAETKASALLQVKYPILTSAPGQS